MKHGTKFNHIRSRVPSRSTYLVATHTHALFFLRDSRAMLEARPSTRSWSSKSSRDSRRSILTSPESWATAAWLIVSGHLQKTKGANLFGIYESSGMLRSRGGSAQLQRTKALSTERQVPHSRTTKGALMGDAWHLGLGDSGVRVVPHFSVDCQGVSRSVGLPACCSAWDGCSRASWVWTPAGRARFSLATISFFVEPLCCPHHCQFVWCRWWCVAPLFLWARVGQVLVDVSTCRSGFVVHFCLIFFFRVPCRCDCASMTRFSAHHAGLSRLCSNDRKSNISTHGAEECS